MTFQKRLQNFQKVLSNNKLDFFVIDDPFDLLYMTGLRLSAGKLLFHSGEAELFVDGRYIENAKKRSPFPVQKLSTSQLVKFFSMTNGSQNKVGFNSCTTTYQSYCNLQKFMKAHDLDYELIALDNPLKELRSIKDNVEITAMKKAAQLAWRGFEYICSILKPGVTEGQVALDFEVFCKRNGAEDLSFEPIIAFGANTACPHHHSGSKVLQEGDAVLVDIGVIVDHYCSDMTRVVFFGEPDSELEKMYALVQRAHHRALALCKPGTKIKDLDIAARSVFSKENLEGYFLHSLGHGIGLQIHEYPPIKQDLPESLELKPGMVITIEPGLYFEEKGGVRYEDTILITQDGYENFYTPTRA